MRGIILGGDLVTLLFSIQFSNVVFCAEKQKTTRPPSREASELNQKTKQKLDILFFVPYVPSCFFNF